MSETFDRVAASAFVREKVLLGMAPKVYAKSLFTKTNAIFALILAIGLPTMAYRFWKGMGAVSNLSQTNPWGIWVAFDVVCGVALAAGGYTVAAAVYLFGQKQFAPVLRPAILTGFLGYAFVLVGLIVLRLVIFRFGRRRFHWRHLSSARGEDQPDCGGDVVINGLGAAT